VYLINFWNRLQVLIDRAWNYFTSRGAGAILLEPPDPPPSKAMTNQPTQTSAAAEAGAGSNPSYAPAEQ
jgi:hypothetical protein